jgi:hypothetical protein
MNGWKNRETWLVNLWFGDTFTNDVEDGNIVTADYIRTFVEEYVDEMLGTSYGVGFIRDMMDMGAIDYDELASHYVTEEEVVEG